jgi:hypothetical protein
MHLHGVALVTAIGDGQHDAVALGVHIGARQRLAVDFVEHLSRLWVDHIGRATAVKLPRAELLGHVSLKVKPTQTIRQVHARR